MKTKYLIRWKEWECCEEDHRKQKYFAIRNFNDEELTDFLIGKDNIKIKVLLTNVDANSNGESPEEGNPVAQIKLIQELKNVIGAHSYDGDVSIQVILPTNSGKYLRVGITDEKDGIWFDYYEGLNKELLNKARETDKEQPKNNEILEALRDLVRLCVHNRGTEHEFISCLRHRGSRDCDIWKRAIEIANLG